MRSQHVTRSPDALFKPVQVGALLLTNRIAMAPLTRCRAGVGLVPSQFAAEYYAQRASAGLIIAEATQISVDAQGYSNTPGCFTDAQVAGWKVVTDAVHTEGGKIVVQLWHTGRVSHTVFHTKGGAPAGPSAIRANTKIFIDGEGFRDASMPRALNLSEIGGIIADFRDAAGRAMEAGFDGVELHGAHGYLLDAFLKDGCNHRADIYGGTIENRARLMLEVATTVAGKIGNDRLGIRLSPVSSANDAKDSQPQKLFNFLVEKLRPLNLAYIHVVEGDTGGARDNEKFDYDALRERFDGAWMVNNGYDRAMAMQAVSDGRADLVSFGRPFITNPDLVERLKNNSPLAPNAEQVTLYGGGAHGYIDYARANEFAS